MEKKPAIFQISECLEAFSFSSPLKFEKLKLLEFWNFWATCVLDVLSNQFVFWVALRQRSDLSLQAVVNVVYWVDLHLSVESTEEYSGAVLDAGERLYFIVVEFEHSEVVDR